MDDHALPEPAMYVLSLLYAVMIAGSVIGNVLVITAVLKSPSMRKVQQGRQRLGSVFNLCTVRRGKGPINYLFW